MRKVLLLFFLTVSVSTAFGQGQAFIGQDTAARPIITAVPFLMIAPDARSGAMGDAGAAISPDANSAHWNVGKLVFAEKDFGASFSYTPWLGKIVDDMNLLYLSGFYKLDDVQAIAFSLRYFDLGEIFLTEDGRTPTAPNFRPQELALDASYSRKLSEKLGLGVTGRYIYSNLAGEVPIGNQIATPGNSIAADVGLFYNSDLVLGARDGNLALAAVISNIGNKISYLDESTESFIPTNLRLGTAYTANLDPFNKITVAVDFNKLLVPTPPIYETDPNTGEYIRVNGEYVVERGQDPNRPLVNGIFTSVADAPDGFSEEMKEITISSGLEYWYNDLFAARAGYFWEHDLKGARKFFTLGIGLRYQIMNFDFAYLIPQQQQHPLAETLRFTLGVNFVKANRNNTPDQP
ncbi:hypothetical protein D770_21565 [Flammeovirgaceae bacterium 311]|nr:hypothetical protein D770_21565 [Flammeovirgaceae bacterium 311]